jgi:hypothetical protein
VCRVTEVLGGYRELKTLVDKRAREWKRVGRRYIGRFGVDPRSLQE